MVLNLRTSERGGREIVGVGQRDQLRRLAAHDERARKNGYKHKMRRIELVNILFNVARREFEMRAPLRIVPHVEKPGDGSDIPSTSRRARTKEWLRAKDAAHRACEKIFRRRPSKS